MTDTAGLMHILQICDSLFPVGAFTLSNGLETYVQHDIITSPKGLEEYLHSYISVLPYNELGAAAAAYNADEKELCRLDEIYSAAKTPFEIRSGSEKVTRRFFKICNNGRESFTGLYKSLTEQGICKGHQCIAYGLYMRDNGIEYKDGTKVEAEIGPKDGIAVYGYSICSAIVTNCVKLVPLSQLAGQKILGESFELISSASEKALFTDINDIGISGAGFDLRAMQHERLYSRQYMS